MKKSKSRSLVSTSDDSDTDINTEEGSHTRCLDKIISARQRSFGHAKSVKATLSKRDSIRENIAKTRRFSTGNLVKEGIFCLNDPNFIAGMKDRQKAIAKGVLREQRRRSLMQRSIAIV